MVSEAESCVPCGAAAGMGSSSAGSSDWPVSSTLVSRGVISRSAHWMPWARSTAFMAGGLLLQSATGALNERSMLPFSLVYHDGFYLPLGAHVFPGEKYRLVHERLLETRVAAESDFEIPQTIELEDVLRVHER